MKEMKKYRRVVKYNYYAVVELEAESEADFKKKVDDMLNNEICGADMIPVSDLDFDQYGLIEEAE